MNIKELISTGANVQLVVNALDLREAFLAWQEELSQTQSAKSGEEKYLTAQEATEKLGVVLSTLWRWDKLGYLKKIKLGAKVYYRQSDINRLMEG